MKEDNSKYQINPYALGAGFINCCSQQGWLIIEGKGRSVKYFITEKGETEIKKIFSITSIKRN